MNRDEALNNDTDYTAEKSSAAKEGEDNLNIPPNNLENTAREKEYGASEVKPESANESRKVEERKVEERKVEEISISLPEYISKSKRTSFILGALSGSLTTILAIAVTGALILGGELNDKDINKVESTKETTEPLAQGLYKENLTPFSASIPKGLSPSGGMYLGNYTRNAPTIDLYADPQCPYCKKFHDEYGPVLSALSKAGYLNIAIKPMDFLGEDSTSAVNTWSCVYDQKGPTGFEIIYDELYKNQDPQKTPGQYSVDKTLGILNQVNLTEEAITDCVTYKKFAEYSKESTNRASLRGVQGTPTLIDEKGNKIDDLAKYLQGLAE